MRTRTAHALVLCAALLPLGCRHNYEYWRQTDPEVIRSVDARLQQLREHLPEDGSHEDLLVHEFQEAWSAFTDESVDPSRLLAAVQEQKFRIKAAGSATDISRATDPDEKTRLTHFREMRAGVNAAIVDAFYGDEANAIQTAKNAVTTRTDSYHPRIGLALSGGGIRSASFATGVLQGLQEIGVLDDVGYLSTVSGGGWAGYWFMTQEDSPARLLTQGSPHLTRVAERGSFLSASNYSKAKTDVALKVVSHLFFIPIHWILNGVFDGDQDILLARRLFRNGIHKTFAYESPVGRVDDKTPRPMADYLPERSGEGDAAWSKPFWIVNMHLALEDEKDWHNNRSGDAFEITPLRAGADAAGYIETAKVPEGSANWMKANRAVAMSSAAVDSRSLQSGVLVNYLTQIANLDLGSYVDGWDPAWMGGDARAFWNNLHFWVTSPFPVWAFLGRIPGMGGVFGATLHEEELRARRYHLTDGGHYDNTGIYALVRRGRRLIIVSDATRDLNVNDWATADNNKRAAMFEDLHELQKLLHADFGADVEIEWNEFVVSTPANARSATSPQTKVLIGKITNLPILKKNGEIDDEVTILCVKSAFNLDEQILGKNTFVGLEKAHEPDFPHDSTAKLFYSERKIMAYRELARQIVLGSRAEFTDAVKRVRDGY